ncbi:hypothetical protein LTR84_012257 [Exophiala bonariae]|uniref:sarcosine oxidasee (formaldehyde-forming) n=1 Tax=Exophiala bonariae TaxID=1690606 RepID=A0AAV9NJC3_9EURO|nr:hypothetical protein LTR84_012257 [Exophiala bonariae]
MAQYDVAVVGLGALGSAAAYYAAKKGAKVIGFEQFELGHVRGASHDTSRIVRTSYDQSQYVALAKSAYKDWAHLEDASKQKLLTITGGVVVIPKDDMPNTPTATEWANCMKANDLPYELLTAGESNKRWPQFNLKDDYQVVYTPDTGIAHAAKSVMTMQFLARFNGAELKEHTKVERVTPRGSAGPGVTIETSKGTYTAKKIILAADAWINELLSPLGLHIPLEVMQEQVTYFKPSDPTKYSPERFPVWILGTPEQWYYGFPTFGEPTIKCAHDTAKNHMTPAERTFEPSPKLLEQLTSAMQDFIPDSGRKVMRTVTCQYAITPDRQFIITPLDRYQDIIVTQGAAHAFKFAPAIGRVAAELAIDGQTTDDISKFGFPASVDTPLKAKI